MDIASRLQCFSEGRLVVGVSIYSLRQVSFRYPKSDCYALRDISLDVDKEEFILVTGEAGVGKSSLMKIFAGLCPQFTGGKLDGEITFHNLDIDSYPSCEFRSQVAYLAQEPNRQFLLEDVFSEIGFLLDNLGLSKDLIEKRVLEVCCILGIEHLILRKLSSLSGGERQRVALASQMVLRPKVLLLDEPASFLSPAGLSELLNLISFFRTQFGITVIVAEQQLEPWLEFANTVVFLESGKIDHKSNAGDFWNIHSVGKERYFSDFMLFARRVDAEGPGISRVRERLENIAESSSSIPSGIECEEKKCSDSSEPSLKLEHVTFGYNREEMVLSDISLNISSEEVLGLVGPNGAGKSTLLQLLCGQKRMTTGRMSFNKSITGKQFEGKSTFVEVDYKDLIKCSSFLPQNSDLYLMGGTVREELELSRGGCEITLLQNYEEWLERFDLRNILSREIFELSPGQRKRVALASLLISNKQSLLLDEPTVGLSNYWRKVLGACLKEEVGKGRKVVVATHDMDFAAEFCDRLCLIVMGRVLASGRTRTVLQGNLYFTTKLQRLYSEIDEGVIDISGAMGWLDRRNVPSCDALHRGAQESHKIVGNA